MDPPEREPWVNYLEGDVLHKEGADGSRVYQVVIRVQASGLLGIVKVRVGQEYFVKFVGAPTLSSLAAKMRNSMAQGVVDWKKDKYPPT